MQILIKSRKSAIVTCTAMQMAGEKKPYILSTTDVGTYNPPFAYAQKVLYLKFNDHIHDQPTSPQPEHAQAIVEFIQSLPDDALLICHCEAGICRSAATALAAYSIKHGVEAAKEYFKDHYGKIWPNQKLARLIEAVCVSKGILKQGELTGLVEWINDLPMYSKIYSGEDL